MAQQIANLPVGAQVVYDGARYYDAPIVWDVLEHGHDGAGTTSLVTDKIICLKPFDAKEPANTDANRKNYGNNRYKYSNLLQWLNSSAGPGAWYTAQHATDQAPDSAYVSCNPYTEEAGFLYGFDPQFRDALLSNPHKTVKNTVTDGGGSEDVTSKVFLPSATEAGYPNETNIAEGSLYAFFAQVENRRAKPTPQAVANSTYQKSGLNADTAWYYILRTPVTSYSYHVDGVYMGLIGNDSAYAGHLGVRPACVIASTTLVSDGPDTDGVYTLSLQTPPESPTALTVPTPIYSGRDLTLSWTEVK